MFVQRGGDGEPVLVLLHGLGATGEVWHGLGEVLAQRWPGSWIVPDLPGHGRSAALPHYSYGHLATELTGAVGTARPVVLLGHSLGGVVALALASGWFGLRVEAACGVGIKVRWSAEDLAKAAAAAGRPQRVFPSRAEAADRYLLVSGLAGLVDPQSPGVEAGLTEVEGGWRLAADPATFGVGAPDLPGLLAACRGEVLLAAGERDPMCPPEHLRATHPDAVVLPGLGHNAHVENPAALWPLLERLLAAAHH